MNYKILRPSNSSPHIGLVSDYQVPVLTSQAGCGLDLATLHRLADCGAGLGLMRIF